MSAFSAAVRSGAILRRSGGGGDGSASTAVRTARSSCLRSSRRWSARSPGVFGDDVDDEVVGEAAERAHARHVVGGGVVARFVLAQVDAEQARAGRRGRPRAEELGGVGVARRVEAVTVDHRAVLGQPEDARLRVARLRLRRPAAISASPNPIPSSPSTASPCLSKPAARPPGWAPTAQTASFAAPRRPPSSRGSSHVAAANRPSPCAVTGVEQSQRRRDGGRVERRVPRRPRRAGWTPPPRRRRRSPRRPVHGSIFGGSRGVSGCRVEEIASARRRACAQ